MNNKKTLIRALCIISAAAVMTGAFTACSKGSDSSSSDGGNSSSSSDKGSENSAEELVKIDFSCDTIKLPDEFNDSYFDSLSVNDDGLSLVNYVYNYDEVNQVSNNEMYLYTLDFEGNVLSKNDITPEKVNEQDSFSVQNVNYLDDGSVIYFENHYYPVDTASVEASAAGSQSDADTDSDEAAADEEAAVEETAAVDTEMDMDADEDYGYYVDEEYSAYKSSKYIVKLAADGTVSKKDISEIPALKFLSENENNCINNIDVNGSGDIAIGYQIYDEEWNSQMGIIVIDKDYNVLFDKQFESSDTWVNGSFSDDSGKFYYSVYTYDSEAGRSIQSLKTVNFETKDFEEVFEWNVNASSDTMIGGSGDYLAYFYNYNSASINGLKADGTSEEAINLLNSGLYLNQITAMCAEGDDFYIIGYDGQPKLYRFRKLDDSEVKEKIKVSLACYYSTNDLQNAVADYNKSDGNYLISMTDYSQYNDYSSDDEEAGNAGLTKLNAEISSGQIPDIISISDPEILASYSAKGLFVDLNTFIDGENGLDRNEYFDNIFRAMENNGKLYSITPSVCIQGFGVKQSLISEDGPITWEQVDSIMNANDGMKLLADDSTREYFMNYALSCGINNFVNTSTGECSFNSPEFVEILERSKDFPEEFSYDDVDENYWNDYELQYMTGKTLLDPLYFDSFDSYYYEADGRMGEDISFVGMPGSGGGAYLVPSSYISISSQSEHADAGWELIRSMLDYDEEKYSANYTRYYGMSYFPVNKQSFSKMGETAIENTYYTDENGNKVQSENINYIGDTEVKMRNVDQAIIDRFESFISSSDNVFMGVESGITDIINEEAAAFYAGTATAQQAADNIQSRATLYLSEHM